MNLSGVLLSAEPRAALCNPIFDETEACLQNLEIAHTLYKGVPGAVDIYIAYRSTCVPEVSAVQHSVLPD